MYEHHIVHVACVTLTCNVVLHGFSINEAMVNTKHGMNGRHDKDAGKAGME